MFKRRDTIKAIIGSVWITPAVVSITLPAHASMSVMQWRFDISYIENCMNCGWDLGEDNGEIITMSPPLQEQRIFEVSEQELENGEFSKSYDADGNGAAADFFNYEITINERSSQSISGFIERSSVDVPDLLRGNFQGNKI